MQSFSTHLAINLYETLAFSPDGKKIAFGHDHTCITLLLLWKPLQQMLQKYACLLSKSRHLSSTSIMMIIKSILNQEKDFTIVSDDNILRFIDCLKRSHKNVKK